MLTKASRERLTLLSPTFRARVEAMLKVWHKGGVNVQVSHGYRSHAEQDMLYSVGRTKPGKVVTNAKAGQSPHNYGLAVDVVIIDDQGKAVWAASAYKQLWKLASDASVVEGVVWAGNWKSFKEYVHFEEADWKLGVKNVKRGT